MPKHRAGVPNVEMLNLVELNGHRFMGLTSGQITYYPPGARLLGRDGILITKQPGSKALIDEGYPLELMAEYGLTKEKMRELCLFWLNWMDANRPRD